jgi:hypothetical protein
MDIEDDNSELDFYPQGTVEKEDESEGAPGEVKSDDSVQVYQEQHAGFRASIRKVHQVHGFEKGPESRRTCLVVLRIQLTNKNADGEQRRWKRLVMRVRFAKEPFTKPELDPWVRAFTPIPEGKGWLTETISKVKRSRHFNITPTVGVEFPPATAEIPLEWGRTEDQEYERRYLHTIEGDREKTEPAYEREHEDIMCWTLRENPREKLGVADVMQVAILLVQPGQKKVTDDDDDDDDEDQGHPHPSKPQENTKFKVHLDIDATINFRYVLEKSWSRFTGKKVKWFMAEPASDSDPPPGVDPDNLGALLENDDKGLRDLSYLHVPEKFMTKEFYGSCKT